MAERASRAARTPGVDAFADKVVVITGAGGRIGRCLVVELERRGAVVVGLDLPAACPPGDRRYVPCDITDETQVRAAIAQVTAWRPGIDVLVHAAELSAIGAFEDHDLAIHRQVMEVTHLGAVSVTQAALPALRRTLGRIVLIGSVAGFAPVLGRPPYVAAKHAATGLFTALRAELAPDGVGVSICHPTFVAGGMSEAYGRSQGRERPVSGEELSPLQVATALLDGVAAGRDVILVGRTAKLAWQVGRRAPAVYERIMTRRLRSSAPTRPTRRRRTPGVSDAHRG